MQIKLTEKGFERYTGELGGVKFENGISEEGINQNQADNIAAAMRVEVIGEGVAGAQRLVVEKARQADVIEARKRGQEGDKPKQAQVAQIQPPATIYSEEDLAKIADAKGISGLREIGEKLGVKGRAVKELMADILKAQAAAAPVKE